MPTGSYILLGYQQRGMRRRLGVRIAQSARYRFQRQKSGGTIMMPLPAKAHPEAH